MPVIRFGICLIFVLIYIYETFTDFNIVILQFGLHGEQEIPASLIVEKQNPKQNRKTLSLTINAHCMTPVPENWSASSDLFCMTNRNKYKILEQARTLPFFSVKGGWLSKSDLLCASAL